jgi:hypothetical protein
MANQQPGEGWWDYTNARTPTQRERTWARLMMGLCVTLVVAGVLIGGTAAAVLIVSATIPLLVWAYLERRTAPPGSGGWTS